MSTSTKPVRRTLAVLKLPQYEVPRLIRYARALVKGMTGNASFPAPFPPLATLAASIDDLAEAETATLTKAAGTAAFRNEKRRVLVAQLQQLMAYVQGVADGSPEIAASIIESAGMAVKKVGVLPSRVFAAKAGKRSGEVILVAPKAAGRAGYEWAYSLDRGETWILLPFTVKATTTVTGLKPGTTVLFRYRAVTKDGGTDWSDPVAHLVV